jgi:hypothetical protein
MRDEVDKPDAVVARIAGRQYGVVSTSQLTRAGITGTGITRRVHSGRLHRVHRGVYAVGHSALAADGRRMAAVLAGGPDAVLSHRSAAVTWELLTASASDVEEITVPGTSGRIRRRRLLVVHRSTTLSPAVITRRRGIPLTTPVRTLLDVRRALPTRLFERALRQARSCSST